MCKCVRVVYALVCVCFFLFNL
uniref:Uncharacterized protein n=1 Tax=Anopheles arabiensis TaxID=7173 RepID=A0A182IH62_ANOAR